jgi:hypothetical protein
LAGAVRGGAAQEADPGLIQMPTPPLRRRGGGRSASPGRGGAGRPLLPEGSEDARRTVPQVGGALLGGPPPYCPLPLLHSLSRPVLVLIAFSLVFAAVTDRVSIIIYLPLSSGQGLEPGGCCCQDRRRGHGPTHSQGGRGACVRASSQ